MWQAQTANLSVAAVPVRKAKVAQTPAALGRTVV
jgi:hypothetical protein